MSEISYYSPTTLSYQTDSQLSSEEMEVEYMPSLEDFDGSEQYPPSDEEGSHNSSEEYEIEEDEVLRQEEIISYTLFSEREESFNHTPVSITRKYFDTPKRSLSSTPTPCFSTQFMQYSNSRIPSNMQAPSSLKPTSLTSNRATDLHDSELSLDIVKGNYSSRRQSDTSLTDEIYLSDTQERIHDEPKFSERDITNLKMNLVMDADAEVEECRIQVEQALKERKEMEQDVSLAEAETNSLRVKLESLRNNHPRMATSNIELRKKLIYLRNELNRRDTELEWYMTEKEKYTNTRQKLDISLKAESEHVEAIQEQMKNDNEKFMAEISMCGMEEKSLRKSIDGSRLEAERARSLFGELKTRYDELKRIMENTRKKESTLIKAVKELQKDVISTEEEVELYREQQNQLNDSVDMRVAEERSKYESDVMEYKARLQSTKEEALTMRERFNSMISQLNIVIESEENEFGM
ncbi:hypothetical protein K7432_003146 [Basidiobolus ranarum]|uniref:Uncharacterized protein n=1 Tax=Basidiobolus ranarum TaxID=34480 RepID=A0ABR2X0E4_9FUNG